MRSATAGCERRYSSTSIPLITQTVASLTASAKEPVIVWPREPIWPKTLPMPTVASTSLRPSGASR